MPNLEPTPENEYFPFVERESYRESTIPRERRTEIDPAIQKTPKASELFVSYFLLSATGFKLPTTEEEKQSFLTGFVASEIVTGGHTLAHENTAVVGETSQLKQVARITSMEMSKADAYFDQWRKDKAKEGNITIENIEDQTEKNDEIGYKIILEIENLIAKNILSREERYKIKGELLKQIALESIKTIAEQNPESIDQIEKLFEEGKDSEAISLTIKLFKKPEIHEIIENTKEKVCNDWSEKQTTDL